MFIALRFDVLNQIHAGPPGLALRHAQAAAKVPRKLPPQPSLKHTCHSRNLTQFQQAICGLCFWTRARFPPLTRARSALHDICMTPDIEPQGSQRRSSRVFTRIPVRATGKNIQGKKFRENSQTIVINAHGGLLYLQEEPQGRRRTGAHQSRAPKKSRSAASSISATRPKKARASAWNFFRPARISGASNSLRKTGPLAPPRVLLHNCPHEFSP